MLTFQSSAIFNTATALDQGVGLRPIVDPQGAALRTFTAYKYLGWVKCRKLISPGWD